MSEVTEEVLVPPTDEEIAWRTKAAPVEQSWYRWVAARAAASQADAAQRVADTAAADAADLAAMRAQVQAWERTRLIVETAAAIFTDQTTSADIPTRQEAKATYAVAMAKLILAEAEK
jgi:hypothetical protein